MGSAVTVIQWCSPIGAKCHLGFRNTLHVRMEVDQLVTQGNGNGIRPGTGFRASNSIAVSEATKFLMLTAVSIKVESGWHNQISLAKISAPWR